VTSIFGRENMNNVVGCVWYFAAYLGWSFLKGGRIT